MLFKEYQPKEPIKALLITKANYNNIVQILMDELGDGLWSWFTIPSKTGLLTIYLGLPHQTEAEEDTAYLCKSPQGYLYICEKEEFESKFKEIKINE